MTSRPALRAAASVVSPTGSGWVPGPLELMYTDDLHRPFDALVDHELLRSGPRVSHLDLAQALLADDVVAAEAGSPDLIVVASALPDLHPYAPVAPYLYGRLGGARRRFTVSEQGSAAAFTALRIASAQHRSGRSRKTAVLIAEQSTHAVPGAGLGKARPSDSAVLLVLDAGDGARVEEVSEMRGPDSTAPLGESLARYAEENGPRRVLIVLGPHVDPALPVPPGAAVHRVDRAVYSTGVWLELARNHSAWSAAYDLVVLCETDARAPGNSHLLALRTGSRTPAADARAR